MINFDDILGESPLVEKLNERNNRIMLSQGLTNKVRSMFDDLIDKGVTFKSINELGRFVQKSELGGWLVHDYGDQSEKSQLSKLCGYLQRHYDYYVDNLVEGRFEKAGWRNPSGTLKEGGGSVGQQAANWDTWVKKNYPDGKFSTEDKEKKDEPKKEHEVEDKPSSRYMSKRNQRLSEDSLSSYLDDRSKGLNTPETERIEQEKERAGALKEGGHRKNIPEDTKAAFVHAICLIKDPQARLEQCKDVFERIKQENIKDYQKTLGISSAEAEVKEDQDEAATGTQRIGRIKEKTTVAPYRLRTIDKETKKKQDESGAKLATDEEIAEGKKKAKVSEQNMYFKELMAKRLMKEGLTEVAIGERLMEKYNLDADAATTIIIRAKLQEAEYMLPRWVQALLGGDDAIGRVIKAMDRGLDPSDAVKLLVEFGIPRKIAEREISKAL